MKSKLLIVDDDAEIRTQMKWALTNDYEILVAENRDSAVKLFQAEQPAVVLLDLGLPPQPTTPEEGFAILSEILDLERLAKVVIVSGQGEKQVALHAINLGAYDFLCKPVEMEELKLILKRCFHVALLEREFKEMQHMLEGEAFEGMFGTSRPMQTVFATIRKVAASSVSILILGESGTGKEMVARAIHNRSARKSGPFVAINCSAIPETLLESELFGHEKGSFTGAHVQRQGLIETAHGGTLFLDEIGEIPLPIQVKLLRFQQERCIQRVGGRQDIQIDTRVVAATNADLKKAMSAGKFREDLFYRLAVVQIEMPPLRDRENDVRLLAQSFLQRFAGQLDKPGLTFDAGALRALINHSWPGNVRELENCIRRAIIMAEGKRLTAKDLELDSSNNGRTITLKEAREAAEREIIERVMRKHSGKITSAAVELGISRPTLYELLEKLGMAKDSEQVEKT